MTSTTPTRRLAARATEILVALAAVAALFFGLLGGEQSEPAGAAAPAQQAPTQQAPTQQAPTQQAPTEESRLPGTSGLVPGVPEVAGTPDRRARGDLGAAATRRVVTAGDTLAGIAQATGVPVELLAADNGIVDPDRIDAGAALEVSVPPADVVVIAEGATLGGYAELYGTTVDRLVAANPQIADPDRIAAGDGLRVAGS